jgi:hypothetical protein
MISSVASANGDLMIMASNGNVGIGTSTPVAGLAVMNGNVGIGTWSPNFKMDVNGTLGVTSNASVGENIFLTGSTAHEISSVSSGAAVTFAVGGSGSGNLTLSTNGGANKDIILLPIGNVGIGTTIPGGALTVMNGNVGIGTWKPATALSVQGDGVFTGGLAAGWPTAQSGFVTVSGGGGITSGSSGASITLATGGGASGNITVDTSAGSGTSKHIILSPGGSVGVGTTTPLGGMAIMNGNVGIGTWSPRSTLEVKNAITFSQEYDEGGESGAFSINWANGNKQKVTVTGTGLDVTFTDPGGVGNFLLKVVQGDGSDTIDWSNETSINWPGGVAPTLSTASGAIDIITCYYDGSEYYCTSSLNFQ